MTSTCLRASSTDARKKGRPGATTHTLLWAKRAPEVGCVTVVDATGQMDLGSPNGDHVNMLNAPPEVGLPEPPLEPVGPPLAAAGATSTAAAARTASAAKASAVGVGRRRMVAVTCSSWEVGGGQLGWWLGCMC